ncbi:MAG: hypothetical protein QNK37_17675 [Acidobacteriota bacterium]|nr:hypothetical protein [Acidobacteriota bacterium]
MAEKKKRFQWLRMVFPVLFATAMLAVIVWPFIMFSGLVAQVGLPPKAIIIMVLATAVILDIVALMKLFETRPQPENRWQWLAFILLVPYVGSTVCLFKELKPTAS